MLLVLRELGEKLGFGVEACHFDHQLRDDSVADLEAVRAICESLESNAPAGGDVAWGGGTQKLGIEETARKMPTSPRLRGGQAEADCIATGHTADDQRRPC